jgi:hypothetical protein
MLKTFVGFKGTAALVQIGDIRFWILAETPRQLETLWLGILSEAGPFDAARCKRAILIEATTLPEKRAVTSKPETHEQNQT